MKPDRVLLVNYYCFFKVVEVQQDIFIIKKVQQHIKKKKKKGGKFLTFRGTDFRFAALTFLSKIFYTQQNRVQNYSSNK